MKLFNGHEKGNFDSHAERFLLKSRFFLGQKPEKFERKCEFFSEPIFFSECFVDIKQGIFDKCAEMILQKNEVLSGKQKLIEKL